jgi:predicted NUDIX family phosphoesterase
MKHQEHIVAIKASLVKHSTKGFVEYTLLASDIILGQRAKLELDEDFRQVIPNSIFLHNGRIWAYERTKKGGEKGLHNQVAVCVGGHWDAEDLTVKNSIVDLEESMRTAFERELEEEVNLTSNVLKSYNLPYMLCASDTPVDRKHIGQVTVHELDGTGLDSNEDQLETIGFINPQELLDGDYKLETWARLVCEMLVAE